MSEQKTAPWQSLVDFIEDLCAREQPATRAVLAKLMGMKLVAVDEALRYLVNDGRIQRVGRGVYAPAKQHPEARSVSRTILPDGMTVLEIGDEVLHLTPREARMISEVMAGTAQQMLIIAQGQAAERMG